MLLALPILALFVAVATREPGIYYDTFDGRFGKTGIFGPIDAKFSPRTNTSYLFSRFMSLFQQSRLGTYQTILLLLYHLVHLE